MRLRKLDRILAAEATLQPVLAKAHELRALSGVLDGFLPPDLARQARVVNYRDGELVLVAATPAAAAKLRLLAPSLANFFSKQRLQVNSVSLRVQPNAARPEAAAPRKSAYLSTLTLERLRNLYQAMAPSPARDALQVLLERRGVIPARKRRT
ncbi:MAG: DciA family protein [Burkholderiales bacterium]